MRLPRMQGALSHISFLRGLWTPAAAGTSTLNFSRCTKASCPTSLRLCPIRGTTQRRSYATRTAGSSSAAAATSFSVQGAPALVVLLTCDGAKHLPQRHTHTRGMCDNVFTSLHHRRLGLCSNCGLWYVIQAHSWNPNDLRVFWGNNLEECVKSIFGS